jgi:hypothetical protein
MLPAISTTGIGLPKVELPQGFPNSVAHTDVGVSPLRTCKIYTNLKTRSRRKHLLSLPRIPISKSATILRQWWEGAQSKSWLTLLLLYRVALLCDKHGTLRTQGLPFFAERKSLEMTSKWEEHCVQVGKLFQKHAGQNLLAQACSICPTSFQTAEALTHEPIMPLGYLEPGSQAGDELDPGSRD